MPTLLNIDFSIGLAQSINSN